MALAAGLVGVEEVDLLPKGQELGAKNIRRALERSIRGAQIGDGCQRGGGVSFKRGNDARTEAHSSRRS